MLRPLRTGGIAAICLAIAACGGPSPSTPEGAMAIMLDQAKAGDLKAMVHACLPPARFAELEAEWDRKRREAVDDAQKAQFAMAMTQLTAPGAEETLVALARPKLAEAQQSLPMIGMMLGMAGGGIAANDKLTPEERAQAQQALAAISGWIAGLRIDDEAKLKQAVGIACATARELKIATLDQLRAMPLDDVLVAGGTAYAGLARILAVYGLDVRATVASIAPGAPAIDGSTAKMPLRFTLLGKEFSGTAVLERIDGAWYPVTPQPPAR